MDSINVQIIHRHDIERNWKQISNNYEPPAGEMIVYDPDISDPENTNRYSKVKIGNGKDTVEDLPFLGDEIIESLMQEIGIPSAPESSEGAGDNVQATGLHKKIEDEINRAISAESTFKIKRADAFYSGDLSQNTFLDTISQDINGDISVTTKTVDFSEINTRLDNLKSAEPYDVVITNEDDFRKCLYQLHPEKSEDESINLDITGAPDPEFTYKSILVKDIEFKESLGSSDIDLWIFQPSLRYIRFENCRWAYGCQWWISGKKPSILNDSTNPTEYKAAEKPYSLIIDNLKISSDSYSMDDELINNDSPYYIGIRNIDKIINCDIEYPVNHAVIEVSAESSVKYRHIFKINVQYFNSAENCYLTAFWDGENVSNCRFSERIKRCKNCTNIIAESQTIRGTDSICQAYLEQCSNLSNILGSPDYRNCSSVDPVTCSDSDEALNPFVRKVAGKNLSTNDLTDDLKSKYDAALNEQQVLALISDSKHLKSQIILELSEVNSPNVLYLLKDATVSGADQYKEYLYLEVDGQFMPVCIGDTSLNLDDYATIASIPVTFGAGDNSVITKDSNNEALAKNSIALGSSNCVGANAWYIHSIVIYNDPESQNESRIYLSNVDLTDPAYTTSNHYPNLLINPTDDELASEEASMRDDTIDLGYGEVSGFDIAVKNYNYFVFKGAKVSRVVDNVVYYTGDLGFTEINTAETTQNYTFWLPNHPKSNGPELLGSASFASGLENYISHSFAHAEGYGNLVAGKYGHAEGNSTKAGGSAHAEGQSTTASGENSHAEGYATVAAADSAHAEGRSSLSSNKQAHAEGYNTKATGESAHAEGNNTTASSKAAHAEGSGTISSGPAAHAEGYGTQAIGARAHTEGNATIAEGQDAHAEGFKSSASGKYAHAEGSEFSSTPTTASGEGSHAEGGGTTASEKYAHAEGRGTVSAGVASHAEGVNTQALAAGAHVEGYGTIAKAPYQHVTGKYNKINDLAVDSFQYVEITGWGLSDTEEQRKNIRTLDTDGNGWYKGDLFVRGNDKDSAAKVATESWVTSEISKLDIPSDIEISQLIANSISANVYSKNDIDSFAVSRFTNDAGYSSAKDSSGAIFNILVVDEMPENPDPSIIYIVRQT